MKYEIILKVYSRKILIVNNSLYNGKYIKTKISLNMYFCNNKMPRENERYAYLSVIILHSIINNK